LKYSTSNYLAITFILVLLSGCAGKPVPKAVITLSDDANKEEQLRLDTAGKAFSQALKELNEKEYEKARNILTSLARQYPEYAGIYANLGIAQMNLGEDEEAQNSFQAALERKADFPQVYNQMGLLHRQHGRFKEAETAYKKAIELDPNYADAHRNLGILYDLYLMDLTNALVHYIKYKELAAPAEKDPIHKWIIDLTNRTNPVR